MIKIIEKMVVTVIINANKKFIRTDQYGNQYYIKYNIDVVEKIYNAYDNVYDGLLAPEKLVLCDEWLVKDENDKIYTVYGYTMDDVNIGSFCGLFMINDDDIYSKIIKGEITAFSVEIKEEI